MNYFSGQLLRPSRWNHTFLSNHSGGATTSLSVELEASHLMNAQHLKFTAPGIDSLGNLYWRFFTTTISTAPSGKPLALKM
jgi:hypothetical protein